MHIHPHPFPVLPVQVGLFPFAVIHNHHGNIPVRQLMIEEILHIAHGMAEDFLLHGCIKIVP